MFIDLSANKLSPRVTSFCFQIYKHLTPDGVKISAKEITNPESCARLLRNKARKDRRNSDSKQ